MPAKASSQAALFLCELSWWRCGGVASCCHRKHPKISTRCHPPPPLIARQITPARIFTPEVLFGGCSAARCSFLCFQEILRKWSTSFHLPPPLVARRGTFAAASHQMAPILRELRQGTWSPVILGNIWMAGRMTLPTPATDSQAGKNC